MAWGREGRVAAMLTGLIRWPKTWLTPDWNWPKMPQCMPPQPGLTNSA